MTKPSDIIRLDDFLALKRRELAAFETIYRAPAEREPEKYPLQMRMIAWVGTFEIVPPTFIDPRDFWDKRIP